MATTFPPYVPPATLIGGLVPGTQGATGTLYAGYTLSGGDDFESSLSLVNALSAGEKYFSTRSYVIPAATQGPRGSSGLGGYDADPYHTGYNDPAHGTAPYSVSDMIVQSDGTLKLKTRIIGSATETAMVNAAQPILSSMVHTGGAMLVQAPCIIEGRIRVNPNAGAVSAALSGSGSQWHPSFWVMPSAPMSSLNGYEFDFESTGTSFGLNGQTWTNGVSSPFPNDYKDIALGTLDGGWHTLSFVIVANAVSWYVDGALAQTQALTNPQNTPYYLLITNHTIGGAGWASLGTSGAILETDWWRMWRKSGTQHRVPAISQPDINVPFSGSFSVSLPSTATIWGSSVTADNLEAVFNEYNAPGGNYSGGWSALLPPCLSYTNGVLSGSGFDKAGRIYMVRAGGMAGESCTPQRFAVNVGPRVTTTSITGTQGIPLAHDLYPECDVGDLLPKSISVTGLPAGMSFISAGSEMGQFSGAPTSAGSGDVSVQVTNAVGQTTTASVPYTIAPSVSGVGVPSPVTSGLIGSLDFDNTSLVTLAGSSITAAAGADGIAPGATQATAAAAPTRVAVNGHYAARFTAASAQYMDWVALISASAASLAGSFTLVVIGELVSSTTTSCFIDIGKAASASTASRTDIILGGSYTNFGFRVYGGASLAAASTGGAPNGTAQMVIGRNSVGGTVVINQNSGTASASAGTGETIGTPDTATIGSRKDSGAYDLPADAYIWRVLVFGRALTDAEVETLAAWSKQNYGTA